MNIRSEVGAVSVTAKEVHCVVGVLNVVGVVSFFTVVECSQVGVVKSV